MRIRSLLLAGLAAGVCAAGSHAAPEDFPKPDSLAPRVEFWKRIYTEVGTDAGFIHDTDDLSLVYEKVSLPNGRWDRRAERFVESRKRHIAFVLRTLARGKRSDLSEEEQRILALFPAGAGPLALRGKAEGVRFQLGQSDKFRAGLVRQGRWDAEIRQVFTDRGLPPELGALPHVESSFNPAARSSVGASGIWQFMPSTGRLFLRVDSAVDERNDPFLSTVAAARLLKSNYDNIGSWPLAITSYNHGLGGMQRAARQLGTKDIGAIIDRYASRSFGFASKNFYASFVAAMEIDREPEKYFGVVRRDPPEDPERVILDHYYRPNVIAAAFGVSVADLREANPAVTELVWSGRRLLPRGYELRVPRDPARPAPRVVLASIGGSDRLDAQVAEAASVHRVRRGETLSRIAARYGVSTRALERANHLRTANQIHVGQRLKIPQQASPAPEPPPALAAAPTPAASASPSAAPEPAPVERVYRVRRGDTLAKVARRFGVSPLDLAKVNKIRNANQIHPGQVLELPGGSLTARPEDRSHAGVYSVRRGDSLETIARKFGVEVGELIAFNGLADRNRIAVGQSIYIPGPAEPATAADPASAAAAPAPAPAQTEAPSATVASAPPAAPPAPSEYVVRRGDTLAKIASRTGVSERDLIALNGIRNRHLLAVGQTLKLSAPPAPESAPPDSESAPQAAPNAPAEAPASTDGA